MASALRRAWSGHIPVRLGENTHLNDRVIYNQTAERRIMTWTKPQAEVVAVTMEVTAYVATL